MGIEVFARHVLFTVFTEFRTHFATSVVALDFTFLHHLGAVSALGSLMVLFLMILQKIFVIHFPACGALYDVPAAISKVRCGLGKRNLLEAIRTGLSLFHVVIILMTEILKVHSKPRLTQLFGNYFYVIVLLSRGNQYLTLIIVLLNHENTISVVELIVRLRLFPSGDNGQLQSEM
jgi:hypothetical protein